MKWKNNKKFECNIKTGENKHSDISKFCKVRVSLAMLKCPFCSSMLFTIYIIHGSLYFLRKEGPEDTRGQIVIGSVYMGGRVGGWMEPFPVPALCKGQGKIIASVLEDAQRLPPPPNKGWASPERELGSGPLALACLCPSQHYGLGALEKQAAQS